MGHTVGGLKTHVTWLSLKAPNKLPDGVGPARATLHEALRPSTTRTHSRASVMVASKGETKSSVRVTCSLQGLRQRLGRGWVLFCSPKVVSHTFRGEVCDAKCRAVQFGWPHQHWRFRMASTNAAFSGSQGGSLMFVVLGAMFVMMIIRLGSVDGLKRNPLLRRSPAMFYTQIKTIKAFRTRRTTWKFWACPCVCAPCFGRASTATKRDAPVRDATFLQSLGLLLLAVSHLQLLPFSLGQGAATCARRGDPPTRTTSTLI